MRQTIFLNLVVLGFFVFLFSALYRRSRSERVGFWILGWVCAVLHFVALLFQPVTPLGQSLSDTFAVSFLFLCGISFLMSVPVRSSSARTVIGLTLAALVVVYVAIAEIAPASRHWLLVLDLAAQVTGLVVLWRYHVERLSLKVLGTVLFLVCSQWTAYSLLQGQIDSAANGLLMEVFALFALWFAHMYARRTAGAVTTIFGLLLWAAVFPASMAVAALLPALTVSPEIWNAPKVLVAFGMLVTLLEDERAEAAQGREQYRSLFDSNPVPMWIFDPNTMQLLEANLAAIHTFGWQQDQFNSMTLNDLLSENEQSPVGLIELNWRLAGEDADGETARPLAAPPEVTRADAIRFQTRTGDEVIVEATLQRIRFQGRQARLLMAKDITAQVEMQRQLIHQANHDPLTGLPNRLLLQDRMTGALATAARYGKKAAVLCIDLDRFKQVNDTFGHAAGDSCLREVAARLRQRLRAVDTAARTGGEEFMILLDDVSSVEDAERVATDILSCLAAPYSYEGKQLRLSASVGIALYPDDGLDAATLWGLADVAMYRAKQGGGDRYVFFSHSY